MQSLSLDDHRALVVSILDRSPLFHGLERDVLEDASGNGELFEFEDGEAIARQGDASDSFYIMIEGEAAVLLEQRGELLELARIRPPDAVGEMGVLLDGPRSATVLASGEVRAMRFTSDRFHAMLLRLPYFGLVMCRTLARRLHAASRRIPGPEARRDLQPPNRDALRLLPGSFQVRHRVLPMKLEGNVLTLGFVDAPASTVLNAVRKQLPGLQLRNVQIPLVLFEEVMQSQSGLRDLMTPTPVEPTPRPRATGGGSPSLDALLERMVAEGASDLHLSASEVPRWRVDGEMRPIGDLNPLGADTVYEKLLHPVMAAQHRLQFEQENDVDFAYELPEQARFRVNLFRDVRGVGAVLRLIPSRVLTLEQLGMPPVLQRFCELPKGLVLVTGPTGSGKSTTLAAMIHHINQTRADHIITLEDPIEFVHRSARSLVNQREVGMHTESFARALRAALREDPDVVLVGEMRDLETVSLALETASTGHLVFGTLHTSTAMNTVDRIINLFPGAQQNQVRATLAETLKAVVAQTLLRRKTGGRVAACEVLVGSHAVSNLIREGKTHQLVNSMMSHKQAGNRLLNEELARLVQGGQVAREEAMAKAVDKADLARRVGG